MKSPFLKFTVFSLFLLLWACRGEDPTTAVQALFDKYQNAIAQGQYEQASYLLDTKTAQYYEKIIDLALNSPKSALEELNFKSKLIALALRQEHSKKELKELDGRQVFAFAAKNKINALDSVGLYSIAKIVMKAEFKEAVARMKRDSDLTETYLKFNKEAEEWKLNFASIMNNKNSKETSVVLTGIKDENKRAIQLIKNISDKRIKRNIWTPASKWR